MHKQTIKILSKNIPVLANSLNQMLYTRDKILGDIQYSILWVDHSYWNYVSCDFLEVIDSVCRRQTGHMHLLFPSTYFQFNPFELVGRIF